MQTLSFDDKPSKYPSTQVQGGALKPITEVLLDRRATAHFRPDPVPDEYLEAILRFAAQAPSGYNLQPWRFVVMRDRENRKQLQSAAFNQSKVGEAPVIIAAFGLKDDWRNSMDQILLEGVRRGIGSAENAEKTKAAATHFLEKMAPAVWLSRHTMIAVTTMMLVAEAYGLDTAPMEGFDPLFVKDVLGLPANAEVIALLAIGYAQKPDKVYGGRLALREIVFEEHYGKRWSETEKVRTQPKQYESLNAGHGTERSQPVRDGSDMQTLVPKCPGCGMSKNEWPGEGYSHEGENYCCQGCAEGTGCTCLNVAKPGFSAQGQAQTLAEPRPGEQRAGASSPKGELSGERDSLGTEEAIDQSGFSNSFLKPK